MRVATFNIRHGAPPGAPFGVSELIASCRELDADVLALQEVDRRTPRARFRDQASLVARDLGLHVTFVANRHWGPFGRAGNALLSRRPLRERRVLTLGGGRHPRRVIVARTFDTTVVATHLENDRHIATAQFADLLGQLGDPVGPLVVLGDLNAGPDEIGPLAERAGLRPVASGPSFPAGAPNRHIDWIATSGVELDDVEVRTRTCSDHLPVVAVLRPSAA